MITFTEQFTPDMCGQLIDDTITDWSEPIDHIEDMKVLNWDPDRLL